MNKALILLVAIFVQSQSDGILLSDPSTDHFQDSQSEGWDAEEFPYAEDISEDYKKRSLTTDAFTRRSALDKNFMRFGRGGEAGGGRLHPFGAVAFDRFGRGAKDNFIRFGRGGEKSGFIRFGRTRPEDFFRAGKSLRENFIRFGKADKNFMRFGRDRDDANDEQPLSEESFQRTEKSRTQDNFMRFGKNGKNGTNFLRFGKSDSDTEDSDVSYGDSASQKELNRKKRQTQQQTFPEETNFNPGDTSRATPFFQPLRDNFYRPVLPAFDSSWPISHKISTSRLTPFFPLFFNSHKFQQPYAASAKRNNGGSNFIRFG